VHAAIRAAADRAAAGATSGPESILEDVYAR
jgi:hypothetical protein